MKIISVTSILIFLIYFNSSQAQSCNNIGFENGTTAGWTVTGTQQVTTSVGVDPFGGFPQAAPGSNFSLKLNSSGCTASQVSTATRVINVTPVNNIIKFDLAMVVINYPHSNADAARITVRFYDATNTALSCPQFEVYYTGSSGFVGLPNVTPQYAGGGNSNCGGECCYGVTYTPWTSTLFDLSPYNNQAIRMVVTVTRCAYYVDWAYCYIDVECQNSFNNIIYDPCQSLPVQLCAEPNMNSYSWQDPNGLVVGTSQCVNATIAGNYVLTYSPPSACAGTIRQDTFLVGYPKPISDFLYDSTCINAPTIQFQATSDGQGSAIASYHWNFGDGTLMDTASPNISYPFNATGTYITELITETEMGCFDTITYPIIIYAQPTASFTFNDGCMYSPQVSFSGSSVPTSSTTLWLWDFGDGNSSNLQNPIHTYTNFGWYNTSLIVEDSNGCQDTSNISLSIKEQPIPSFTYNNTCDYDTLQFTNTTLLNSVNFSLNWDFGDGNNDSILNPTHFYSGYGSYLVELIITSDSGCIDSILNNIYVNPQPTANFTFNDSCVYAPSNFQDISTIPAGDIISWNWNLDDGNTSNLQNVSHLYSNSGLYNVTLIVTSDSTCTDTLSMVVERFPTPIASFNVNDVCVYDSISCVNLSTISSPDTLSSFLWNFGDGSSIISATNPQYIYQDSGTYTISLIASSENNCLDDTSYTVNIHPKPVANFIADTVCVNTPSTSFVDLSTVGFNDQISIWAWSFNNNSGSSNLQNPSFNFNESGIFPTSLIVISSFGCRDSVYKNVKVYEKPFANFAVDTNFFCHPYCVNFTDLSYSNTSNIATWFWDLNNGDTATIANPYTCYNNESNTQEQYYSPSLIIENDFGCFDTVVKADFITVFPLPAANFNVDTESTSIYEPQILFDNVSINANIWLWNFDDGNYDSINYSPAHSYADSGNYQVLLEVWNEYGCYDSTWKEVRIEPVFAVFIPNAFTPDNYLGNETFFFKGYGIVEEDLEFYIFNRWGEQIYFTDHFIPWDGTYKGQPVQQDVYIYQVALKDVFNVRHFYNGHVTLLK